MLRTVFLIVSLLLITLGNLHAAVYYVSSKKGSDKNSGKAPGSAWQTLKHACSRLSANDTLMVFRGSVFREENVNLGGGTVDAFGPKNLPLPVLAGSRSYTKFETSKDNKKIYVVNCADDVQHLYVNGKLMNIARYPNTGWARTDAGNSGSQIKSTELAKHPRNKSGYWNGANVRWRRWSWWFETRVVQNWDGQKVMRLAGQPIGPNHNGDASGFYMDNKFEELDYPSEWFLDKAAKKLYIYPGEDIDDINTALVEGVVFDEGMKISGGTVKNLEFRHYKKKAVGFGRPGIIDSCVFRGITDTAVTGAWDANGSIVRNSLFEDCLNVGISWNENKANKSKTEFHHNTMNRIGTVPGYGGSGVWHASAIIVTNANGVRIHHNRIHGTGYCGVILGSPNQVVEYNVFRKCMSTLNDGGAVYTNCDASIIRHNIILDTVGNNISSQKWANLGQGIWPEFLSQFKNTKIINNTVVNSGCHGIFLYNNYTCEVTGNVLLGNKDGILLKGKQGQAKNQNHNISDNTFVAMSPEQTPIRFRDEGFNYGTMTNNAFINPYANWVATDGKNWQSNNMTLVDWQKQYAWADKNPATFIGKVNPTSKSLVGRPHCFINDTVNDVQFPIKGTWYTAAKEEYKDVIELAPFTSVALILGKGNPGKLNGDYSLFSELNAGEASEVVAKADKKSSRRSKKDKKEKKEKAPKKTASVDDETMKAWGERLKKALEEKLASGKHPYFDFMGKQYRVDELSGGKILKISSGSQEMSYPLNRLKLKDRCSLAKGIAQKGTNESLAVAAFFFYADGKSKEGQSYLMKIGKEERDQVEQDLGLAQK